MMNEKIISPMISKLKEDIKTNNYKVVERFWDKVKSSDTPLAEKILEESGEVFLTFLYEDNEDLESLMVYGGIPGFRYEENKLEKIKNSNIWFRTYKVKMNIKFKYQFCKNYIDGDSYSKIKEKSILDQLNSRIVIRCKDYENPDSKDKIESYAEIGSVSIENWTSRREDTKEGYIKLYRKCYDNVSRRIWIYMPHNYDQNSMENNLLVLTDGFDYIYHLNAKNVLDNLIHENKVNNTIAIFIENGDKRYEELTCNEKFADFIVNEIIPWVREKYRITKKPENCVIGGLSLGGLFASYIGFKYSSVFGNVLSQSGSYWWEKCFIIDEYRKSREVPIITYLNCGVLEDKPYDDGEPTMMECISEMRDVLMNKNYVVEFEQFPSSHDFLSWGEYLGRGLIKLLPCKE